MSACDPLQQMAAMFLAGGGLDGLFVVFLVVVSFAAGRSDMFWCAWVLTAREQQATARFAFIEFETFERY